MSKDFKKVPASKILSRFQSERHDGKCVDGEDVVVLSYNRFEQLEQLRQNLDGVLVGVVCDGTLRLSINNRSYNLGENHIFVMHKNTQIEKVKPSKRCVGYMIVFRRKFMLAMDVETKDYMFADLNARTTPVIQVDDKTANSINEIVISMVDVARSEQSHYLVESVAALNRAIFYIILSVLLTNIDIRSNANKSNRYMLRFVELLSQHYSTERSVEFYASSMGITAKYLTMICRKYRDLTASQIIDNVVMHNAMSLLRQHGVSIQQVSEKLNFPSQSFFGKYFKQRLGISPSRYKGGEY